MIKIIKVISGGQTGADQGGLIAAERVGIPTGGWAPKGWQTEKGPAEELLKHWGLKESHGDYPVRTLQNIQEADLTILIAEKLDRGSLLTLRKCEAAKCPCFTYKPGETIFVDLIIAQFSWAEEGLTLNVAGNRESRSPGIGWTVANSMEVFLRKFNQ